MPTRDAAPHVFLIGWTGCTQRHLQKYADIWSSEGVTKTTLVLEHCAMGISERWRREVDAVAADVLAQMVSAGAPIIVHVFSNGGGHVWAALGRRDDRNVQIVGLVADSAPGYLNSPTTAFNFFWETQRSKFARGGLMLVAAVVPASAIALVVAISRLQPLLRLVTASRLFCSCCLRTGGAAGTSATTLTTSCAPSDQEKAYRSGFCIAAATR